jgi:hypothetical protein
MKSIFLSVLILFSIFTHGQIKIHAHNDYAKPEPLFNALRNKAFTIEADVFLINDRFFVAHTAHEIDSLKTLQSIYINPIIKMFNQNDGQVSPDNDYVFSLVIDIKNRGTESLKKLSYELQNLTKYFDRAMNSKAVQIIISGDRGPIDLWKHYPSFIYFDGRPFEKYDSVTLSKVAMVSDNYNKYAVALPPDIDRIKSITQQIHNWNKPIRFWAAPDNEKAWKLLKDAGVDIINTDRVADCRKWIDGL